MTSDWSDMIICCCVVLTVLVVYIAFKRIKACRVKITLLLEALENGDTSIKFPESPDRDVNKMLNRVGDVLRRMRHETAEKERYYELILERVGAGVMSIYDTGVVFQVNGAALSLLNLDVLTHMRQLQRVSETLMRKLETAQNNDRFSVDVAMEGVKRTLSVNVSTIMLQERELKIIVLDDISDNLDRKEVDSWMKLTRVMTHEIMNSLGPITSLSETLAGMSGDGPEELREGLSTIAMTGRSLVNFVSSYRRLAYMPKVRPVLFAVRPFLERMVALALHYAGHADVDIVITECDAELIAYADENIMGQVLANLLKNAVEAVADVDTPKVELSAYCDSADMVVISVSDNGPLIPDEVIEEIFVPFFTTKSDGSGIGLSISRRMVQLNGGSLTLVPYSTADDKTTFIIKLP